MKKEEIKKLLLDEFGSVYCHNCGHQDGDYACDECHRKMMKWTLSEERAETIAEMIAED